MASVRPTVALNKPNAKLAANLWITDCKLCRRGVYQGQERVWLTHPMGISHTGCARMGGLL